MGPVGSAKTSHCATWLLDKASKIRPCKDGVRRSRTLITRSTYPELKSAWLATWKQWYGANSVIKDGDLLTISVNAILADGTRMEWEAVLVALAHQDDLSKLRGVEFTNAIINEGSTCAPWILKEVSSRMGRYPAKWQFGLGEDETIQNGPDYYSGVLIDTNPPEEGASPCDPTANWVYRLIECAAPKDPKIEVIKQPGALLRVWNEAKDAYDYMPNPAATYARLQSKGYNYWLDQLAGLAGDDDKIKVLLLGLYGLTVDGTPVFPEFDAKRHEVSEDEPDRGRTVVVAVDTSGVYPAATVWQRSMRTSKPICYDEIHGDFGLDALIEEHLKPLLENRYIACPVQVVLDPSNPKQGGQLMTALEIFIRAGFAATLAHTNDWEPRRNTVQHFLRTNMIGIGPRAHVVRMAFHGRYIYKHTRTGQSAARPHKQRPYADIMDTVQYALMYYYYGDQRSVSLPPPPPQKKRAVA